MQSFLLWVGLYNVVGSLALIALLREAYAEKVLGKWLQLLGVPYSHGDHGRMWIWWSMCTNLGLGALMMLASRWPTAMQREVTIVVVAVYAIMLGVLVAATRSPRYRASGLWGTAMLWVAQIAWGCIGIASA